MLNNFRLSLASSTSSSGGHGSSRTLCQEYDDIQKANIFPSVQEDSSVSDTVGESESESSSVNVSNVTTVESLQAEVESLRAQLAERDSTVNELQRQIVTDKRDHAKFQQKWDLFFGTNNSLNSNSNHNSTSNEATLHRLHKHIQKLEADKAATVQKTVKLSVALANSKAKVSTLETQIEEYQSIIILQNTTPGFSRLSTSPSKTTPKPSPQNKNKKLTLLQSPTSVVSIHDIDLNDNVHDIEDSDDSQRPTKSISLPLADSSSRSLSVCSSNHRRNSQSTRIEEQAPYENDNDNDNDSECLSLESESLEWSSRPLSYLSERGSSTRRRMMGNASERSNRFSNSFRGLKSMLSHKGEE